MTVSKAIERLRDVCPVGPTWTWSSIRLIITTRTSWMANNAIPDSIIMNMIRWSLGPPVELNEPNVRSTDVASGLSCLTSKNTVRILNTIKPVTSAFTSMDAARPVIIKVFPQGALTIPPSSIDVAPVGASQVARGDKLESAYKTKTYSLTYIYDCQKWRNNHDTDIFTPHDPTTVYLWVFRWTKQK